MNKDTISKEIIGLTYEDTIEYFNQLTESKFYFRPVQMDNIILWKDDNMDYYRCNIVFINNIVNQIDGWY